MERESGHQKRLRQTLHQRLLDAVKQVQERFGGGVELCTEDSPAVSSLLTQLEAAFAQGLRRSLTGPALDSIRHLTERLTRLKLDSLSSDDLNLWLLVRCVLSETETVRFLRLRKITSDTGRGRAWLRAALNERTLAPAFTAILGNQSLLKEFYDEEAFLRDTEITATLPQIAQGLCSVVFALSIDEERLNSSRCDSVEVAEASPNDAPTPVMAVSARRAPSQERRRRRKPLVNLVSFQDGPRKSFTEAGGSMRLLSSRQNSASKAAPSARKSLEARVEEPAQISPHSASSQASESNGAAQEEGGGTINDLLLDSWARSHPGLTKRSVSDDASEASSGSLMTAERRALPPLAISASLYESLSFSSANGTPEVFPDEAGPNFPKPSPSVEEDKVSVSSSKLSSGEGTAVEALRGELALLRRRNADLKAGYESRLKTAEEEKEQLRYQLRGYMEAVSALNEAPSKESEPSLYEQKLIQVAQMHAELSEFNERLQRALQRKTRRLGRLRAELQSLRGPAPGDFSDEEVAIEEASEEDQPRVHLWIPSFFQTGKGTDVHHVYQVYVRIASTEWNVYRRYRDFWSLRKSLIGLGAVSGLPFPPKKAIGKKEANFVESRRKALETWLREAINLTVADSAEFSAIPLNKRTLAHHFPFFQE